ncbi:MAG: hypothetical protein KKA73_02700 [Chloroflexi bacterium]|nr:hypothetical protein [Chloroflexota bacterium]MBU1746577.1 hypothetical protein [Chloroflexota bacterium]
MKNGLALALLTLTLAGCAPGLASTPIAITPVPENAFVRSGPVDLGDPVRGLYGAAGDYRWVDVYRLGDTELTWQRAYLDRTLPVTPPAYVSVRVQRLLGDDGPIRWAVLDWEQLPLPAVEAACASAIRDNSAAIESVDLGPLSHPGYAKSTAAWRPATADLADPRPVLMAVDAESQAAICRWQGPTLPSVKPLVTRWLVLYPVYDLQAGRVTRIMVTIEGQVEE